MVRPIMKDPMFLALPSEEATAKDKPVAFDLLDTLRAHLDGCVGMAANMIGVRKRIIVISLGFEQIVMINPEIIAKSGLYETEEGCLSLAGVRKTTRYERIEVSYQDLNMKKHKKRFEGYAAQIVQHEVDHCNGVLI